MEMHPLPEDQLVLVRGSELYVGQSVYAYADGADMMIPSWVVDKIEDGSVTLSLYDKKGTHGLDLSVPDQQHVPCTQCR